MIQPKIVVISHVKAVFSLTGLAPTPKFVLLALADMADARGECWPSISRLCEMTSFTERTVQGAVLQLCKNGFISRKQGNGRTHTTVYRILVKGAVNAPFVNSDQSENPAAETPIAQVNGAANAGLEDQIKGAANAGKGAFAALKGAANAGKGAGDAPEETTSTKEENRSTISREPPAPKINEPDFPTDLPEEYRIPLRLWWQHKRERGKTYKPTGWAMLISQQRKKPAAELQRDVEFSVGQNYEGIFAPRQEFSRQPKHKAYNHEDATRGKTVEEICNF